MDYSKEQRHSRPQDDVPYEVIVKYIICDYRRNLQALEMLEPYTRQLEEVVRQQQEEINELRKCKEENRILTTDLQQAKQRISELAGHIRQLKQNEDNGIAANRRITKTALQHRIKQLEQWIISYNLPVPEPTQSQILRYATRVTSGTSTVSP